MFGYIKPYPPELKVKEYDFYRSVYCGLCHALGHVALCAKFTLSYDIVFLAFISISLSDNKPELIQRRCLVHPLKKRSVLALNESLTLSAEVGALLSYYKIIDDFRDSRGLRRLSSILLFPVVAYIKRKIAANELNSKIKGELEKLNAIEKAKTASADEPAEAFGNMLAAVFAHVCGDGNRRRIGEVIGKHTGRWIYLIDALDDLDKDRKHNLYNPFLYNGGVTPGNAQNALTGELIQIEKAIDLIDFYDSGIENIIKNILYIGMPRRANEIINKLS